MIRFLLVDATVAAIATADDHDGYEYGLL